MTTPEILKDTEGRMQKALEVFQNDLRGRELHADVLLKATQVDGVYDFDPKKNEFAQKFKEITFDQVIQKQLGVMDIGAFEMCRQAKLPILVFNYTQDGAIERAVAGQPIGTVVSG